MPKISLEADYLVVGSGALGLAFTDALVAASNARVILVDRRARPGGHWNDAYRFVRLHVPSAFYGVNSLPLGHDRLDQTGLNQGLYELASGAEVAGYFDRVMQEKLLPSGRVQYFPMCDYRGGTTFVSQVSGATYEVNLAKAVVDATYTNTQLPSTHKRSFTVADGVRCIPVNDLVRVQERAASYVVMGASKTAIDACLWLLEQGVEASAIRWIRPRDAWLVNRAHLQPGALLHGSIEGLALQMEAARDAESVADLFARLHASRHLLRIDDRIEPSMYRCSTVSEAELVQLRRIEDVIRLGHVQRLERGRIVLSHGSVESDPESLYVDCTAAGISHRVPLPVFGERSITLQAVRVCQPSFSAALIGHVEANYTDLAQKNALCTPIPYPSAPIDWLRMTLAGTLNEQAWRKDPALRRFIEQSRLQGRLRQEGTAATGPDQGLVPLQQRIRESTGPALLNLKRLLAQMPAAPS
jgi:hypothetical protein